MTTTTEQTTDRARALDDAFSGRSSAAAYVLDGSDYIVTSGTGEGCDFAYDAADIDIDEVSADGWDYLMWCNGVDAVSDIRIAVAYYMQTGRVLGRGGACTPQLTAEQTAILDIARSVA